MESQIKRLRKCSTTVSSLEHHYDEVRTAFQRIPTDDCQAVSASIAGHHGGGPSDHGDQATEVVRDDSATVAQSVDTSLMVGSPVPGTPHSDTHAARGSSRVPRTKKKKGKAAKHGGNLTDVTSAAVAARDDDDGLVQSSGKKEVEDAQTLTSPQKRTKEGKRVRRERKTNMYPSSYLGGFAVDVDDDDDDYNPQRLSKADKGGKRPRRRMKKHEDLAGDEDDDHSS